MTQQHLSQSGDADYRELAHAHDNGMKGDNCHFSLLVCIRLKLIGLFGSHNGMKGDRKAIIATFPPWRVVVSN